MLKIYDVSYTLALLFLCIRSVRKAVDKIKYLEHNIFKTNELSFELDKNIILFDYVLILSFSKYMFYLTL